MSKRVLGPMTRATLLAACLGAGASAAMAAERAIIVLDASGSMWGQIDGTAKIEIARRTLGKVLGGLPGDMEMGLIAYGHRKKGQCTDIELMVPAGKGTAAAISKAVNGLKPKGKTPLSSSVKMAAEALKYTEEKATVILITDGLETCDADPCALGRSLEELGVDFTAHVVGFGLSDKEGKEVACLAEETGGVYIPAGGEEELVEALDRAVIEEPKKAEVKEPEPEPDPEARLTALGEADMLDEVTVRWEGPGEPRDRIELWDPEALAGEGKRWRVSEVRRGDIDARTVTLLMPARPGAYELRYVHNRKILATRPITVTEIPVSVAAESPIAAAERFIITWEGPGLKQDEIRLWDPNALGGEGKLIKRALIRNGDLDERTVEMVAPAKPGSYELRYYNATDRMVLASQPLEVTEIAVSLDFESPAKAGSTLTIKWDGPGGKYDEVYIHDPRGKGGDGRTFKSKRVRSGDFEGQTVTLPVPAKAGDYEVRYWNGDNKTDLASAPLVVDPVDVTLDFESPVKAGSTLTIKWDGPGARYDEVYIFDPRAKGGDGGTFKSKRVRSGDFEGQTVKLPVPAKPGDYEVRYWSGDSKVAMASVPLVVEEVTVSLDFPSPVKVGSTLTVKWDGPGARYDEVYIFDPSAKGGEGKTFKSKRLRNDDYDGQTVKLPVPAKAGDYEVRYWNGDSKVAMASVPLIVEDIAVSLEAADSLPAGSVIKVTWDGPGARYDDVQLWDPQAKGGDGKVIASKRLRNDDYDNQRATMPGPAKPGTYELRYWNGDSRVVMATRPIEITPVVVTLTAPDQIEAGKAIRLEWDGPGARYDDVQLWDPNAKGGKGRVMGSTRLRNADYDNKRAMVFPKTVKPGSYELRYWYGDDKTVLATRPIEITPSEVAIIGPEAVEPETKFGIEWQGPGARYDDVQIFDPKAKAGKGRVVYSKRLRNDDYDNQRATLIAPKEPGEYVMRYYHGGSKAVMLEVPLSVN